MVEPHTSQTETQDGLRGYRLLVPIVAVIVVADQWTKAWAADRLPGNPIQLIDSWLSFQYAENTGAAFSLFPSGGPLIGVLASIAVVIVAYSVRNLTKRSEVVAVSLIAAGALGNLIDRIVRGEGTLDGYVVDFVRLWDIPNFNVADSAITVGAALLIGVSLFAKPESP